jgi:hypothetical protein
MLQFHSATFYGSILLQRQSIGTPGSNIELLESCYSDQYLITQFANDYGHLQGGRKGDNPRLVHTTDRCPAKVRSFLPQMIWWS